MLPKLEDDVTAPDLGPGAGGHSFLLQLALKRKEVSVSFYFRDTVNQGSCKGGGGQGGSWAPPLFGTTKTSAFATNAQSRFASVVLDGVLGPDKDRLEDMDVSVNFPTRRKRPMIFPRPLGLNGSQV